jgi:hypothetical protein
MTSKEREHSERKITAGREESKQKNGANIRRTKDEKLEMGGGD